MSIKKFPKENYQWAIYMRGLPKDKLKALIDGLKGNISLGVDVSRNEGYLKYAKELFNSL